MGKIISIALCTYNGERFLGEQLASLCAQSHPPDELIVCDDKSTDGTVLLLKKFAGSAPFPVKITINKTRLGPAANFGEAVAQCKGDVLLFCDQDDVWHPDKIAVEVEAIANAERRSGENVPVLVHSDVEVVDQNLTRLHPSFMQIMHPKLDRFDMAYILGENVAVGCTIAVNRPLLEIALPIPKQAQMHDWWFAQCATACGQIVYIDQPLLQYRQHGNNQIGASRWSSRLAKAFASPARKWTASLNSFRLAIVQAGALRDRLAQCAGLTGSDGQTISDYASLLDVGAATRILRALHYGYGRSGRLGIMWFFFKAIFA